MQRQEIPLTLDCGQALRTWKLRSWNQGRTGTDQLRFFELEGDTRMITTGPFDPGLRPSPDRVTTRWQREITWPIFSG
jgi:hypothetical protein